MQLKIKLLLSVLILYFIPMPIFAGVDLEINNNMQIEITSGLEIELTGDLVENGTGRLKGTVTSGSRAAVTQFAGLTLSSPLNGIITCITGTQYSGTGTNFTRYYEINNQNTSTDLTANVSVAAAASEAGNLIGPFFLYTKNGSNWMGYGFGSTGTTVAGNNVIFPQNSQTDLVISEGVGIKARIFLEGAYNTINHDMSITINGDIPLTSPYKEDIRTASTKPSTAVDWVLVQLHDAATPSTVIASRSAYLNSVGNLIDDNVTSGRGIGIAAPPGDYFIVIKHRNHLAVMTSGVQKGLTWGTASIVSTYDFTGGKGQFYGGSAGAIEVEPGVWGMIAGDANGDGQVNASDRNATWNSRNQTGYLMEDVSLDGQVNATDRNTTWNNRNLITQVLP